MVAPVQPPPLPASVLQRVLTIARLDGLSVVGVAAAGSGLAAIMGDPTGTVVGGGVVLAGMLELAGVRSLKNGRVGGVDRLVASQLLLLALIWSYVGARLWQGTDTMVARLLTPDRLAQLAGWGVDTGRLLDLVHLTLPITYGVIVLATLAYQGGLALFYHRQRGAIRSALG
ncbi:MAG: hypothetical protein ABII82_00680 [Verrucomicrobiota bacterium]